MEATGSPLTAGAAIKVKKNVTKLGEEKPLRFSPLFIRKWPGNNRFLFNGRYITGSSPWGMYISTSLIVVPSLFFLILNVRFQDEALLYATPCIVLMISSLFLLFRTACTDPGIIPRNPPDTEENDPIEEYVNGVKVIRKFCKTCRIYRNPRSKHCVECNNCVKRFDHHCPWVSNCVGQRNYYHFVLFIASVFLLCAYVTVMCVLYAEKSESQGNGEHMAAIIAGMYKNPLLLAVSVVASLMGIAIGNMLIYHLGLISMNKTTNEALKEPYGADNPFTLGCYRNCRSFCVIPADTSELYKVDAILRAQQNDDADVENVNQPILYGRSSSVVEMEDIALTQPEN